MNKKILAEQIINGQWNNVLSDKILPEVKNLTEKQIIAALDRITSIPMKTEGKIGWPFLGLYYIACWKDIFEKIKLPLDSNILEVASGSTAQVPQALEIYSNGKGNYKTANLNKKLTAGLKNNTNKLKIKVEVIEDNASNLGKYVKFESIDVIVFHHAINDVLQGIIADKNGLDTINNDWFAILPELLKGIAESNNQGKLKNDTYEEFMGIIEICWKLLKKDGYMVFNNFIFKIDLDNGLPLQLYSSFVPLARDWIINSQLKVENIDFQGYDPQWWLFLKK